MFRIIYDFDDGTMATYGVTIKKSNETEANKIYNQLVLSDYCFNVEMFDDNLEYERGIGNEKI